MGAANENGSQNLALPTPSYFITTAAAPLQYYDEYSNCVGVTGTFSFTFTLATASPYSQSM